MKYPDSNDNFPIEKFVSVVFAKMMVKYVHMYAWVQTARGWQQDAGVWHMWQGLSHLLSAACHDHHTQEWLEMQGGRDMGSTWPGAQPFAADLSIIELIHY